MSVVELIQKFSKVKFLIEKSHFVDPNKRNSLEDEAQELFQQTFLKYHRLKYKINIFNSNGLPSNPSNLGDISSNPEVLAELIEAGIATKHYALSRYLLEEYFLLDPLYNQFYARNKISMALIYYYESEGEDGILWYGDDDDEEIDDNNNNDDEKTKKKNKKLLLNPNNLLINEKENNINNIVIKKKYNKNYNINNEKNFINNKKKIISNNIPYNYVNQNKINIICQACNELMDSLKIFKKLTNKVDDKNDKKGSNLNEDNNENILRYNFLIYNISITFWKIIKKLFLKKKFSFFYTYFNEFLPYFNKLNVNLLNNQIILYNKKKFDIVKFDQYILKLKSKHFETSYNLSQEEREAIEDNNENKKEIDDKNEDESEDEEDIIEEILLDDDENEGGVPSSPVAKKDDKKKDDKKKDDKKKDPKKKDSENVSISFQEYKSIILYNNIIEWKIFFYKVSSIIYYETSIETNNSNDLKIANDYIDLALQENDNLIQNLEKKQSFILVKYNKIKNNIKNCLESLRLLETYNDLLNKPPKINHDLTPEDEGYYIKQTLPVLNKLCSKGEDQLNFLLNFNEKNKKNYDKKLKLIAKKKSAYTLTLNDLYCYKLSYNINDNKRILSLPAVNNSLHLYLLLQLKLFLVSTTTSAITSTSPVAYPLFSLINEKDIDVIFIQCYNKISLLDPNTENYLEILLDSLRLSLVIYQKYSNSRNKGSTPTNTLLTSIETFINKLNLLLKDCNLSLMNRILKIKYDVCESLLNLKNLSNEISNNIVKNMKTYGIKGLLTVKQLNGLILSNQLNIIKLLEKCLNTSLICYADENEYSSYSNSYYKLSSIDFNLIYELIIILYNTLIPFFSSQLRLRIHFALRTLANAIEFLHIDNLPQLTSLIYQELAYCEEANDYAGLAKDAMEKAFITDFGTINDPFETTNNASSVPAGAQTTSTPSSAYPSGINYLDPRRLRDLQLVPALNSLRTRVEVYATPSTIDGQVLLWLQQGKETTNKSFIRDVLVKCYGLYEDEFTNNNINPIVSTFGPFIPNQKDDNDDNKSVSDQTNTDWSLMVMKKGRIEVPSIPIQDLEELILIHSERMKKELAASSAAAAAAAAPSKGKSTAKGAPVIEEPAVAEVIDKKYYELYDFTYSLYERVNNLFNLIELAYNIKEINILQHAAFQLLRIWIRGPGDSTDGTFNPTSLIQTKLRDLHIQTLNYLSDSLTWRLQNSVTALKQHSKMKNFKGSSTFGATKTVTTTTNLNSVDYNKVNYSLGINIVNNETDPNLLECNNIKKLISNTLLLSLNYAFTRKEHILIQNTLVYFWNLHLHLFRTGDSLKERLKVNTNKLDPNAKDELVEETGASGTAPTSARGTGSPRQPSPSKEEEEAKFEENNEDDDDDGNNLNDDIDYSLVLTEIFNFLELVTSTNIDSYNINNYDDFHLLINLFEGYARLLNGVKNYSKSIIVAKRMIFYDTKDLVGLQSLSQITYLKKNLVELITIYQLEQALRDEKNSKSDGKDKKGSTASQSTNIDNLIIKIPSNPILNIFSLIVLAEKHPSQTIRSNIGVQAIYLMNNEFKIAIAKEYESYLNVEVRDEKDLLVLPTREKYLQRMELHIEALSRISRIRTLTQDYISGHDCSNAALELFNAEVKRSVTRADLTSKRSSIKLFSTMKSTKKTMFSNDEFSINFEHDVERLKHLLDLFGSNVIRWVTTANLYLCLSILSFINSFNSSKSGNSTTLDSSLKDQLYYAILQHLLSCTQYGILVSEKDLLARISGVTAYTLEYLLERNDSYPTSNLKGDDTQNDNATSNNLYRNKKKSFKNTINKSLATLNTTTSPSSSLSYAALAFSQGDLILRSFVSMTPLLHPNVKHSTEVQIANRTSALYLINYLIKLQKYTQALQYCLFIFNYLDTSLQKEVWPARVICMSNKGMQVLDGLQHLRNKKKKKSTKKITNKESSDDNEDQSNDSAIMEANVLIFAARSACKPAEQLRAYNEALELLNDRVEKIDCLIELSELLSFHGMTRENIGDFISEALDCIGIIEEQEHQEIKEWEEGDELELDNEEIVDAFPDNEEISQSRLSSLKQASNRTLSKNSSRLGSNHGSSSNRLSTRSKTIGNKSTRSRAVSTLGSSRNDPPVVKLPDKMNFKLCEQAARLWMMNLLLEVKVDKRLNCCLQSFYYVKKSWNIWLTTIREDFVKIKRQEYEVANNLFLADDEQIDISFPSFLDYPPESDTILNMLEWSSNIDLIKFTRECCINNSTNNTNSRNNFIPSSVSLPNFNVTVYYLIELIKQCQIFQLHNKAIQLIVYAKQLCWLIPPIQYDDKKEKFLPFPFPSNSISILALLQMMALSSLQALGIDIESIPASSLSFILINGKEGVTNTLSVGEAIERFIQDFHANKAQKQNLLQFTKEFSEDKSGLSKILEISYKDILSASTVYHNNNNSNMFQTYIDFENEYKKKILFPISTTDFLFDSLYSLDSIYYWVELAQILFNMGQIAPTEKLIYVLFQEQRLVCHQLSNGNNNNLSFIHKQQKLFCKISSLIQSLNLIHGYNNEVIVQGLTIKNILYEIGDLYLFHNHMYQMMKGYKRIEKYDEAIVVGQLLYQLYNDLSFQIFDSSSINQSTMSQTKEATLNNISMTSSISNIPKTTTKFTIGTEIGYEYYQCMTDIVVEISLIKFIQCINLLIDAAVSSSISSNSSEKDFVNLYNEILDFLIQYEENLSNVIGEMSWIKNRITNLRINISLSFLQELNLHINSFYSLQFNDNLSFNSYLINNANKLIQLGQENVKFNNFWMEKFSSLNSNIHEENAPIEKLEENVTKDKKKDIVEPTISTNSDLLTFTASIESLPKQNIHEDALFHVHSMGKAQLLLARIRLFTAFLNNSHKTQTNLQKLITSITQLKSQFDQNLPKFSGEENSTMPPQPPNTSTIVDKFLDMTKAAHIFEREEFNVPQLLEVIQLSSSSLLLLNNTDYELPSRLILLTAQLAMANYGKHFDSSWIRLTHPLLNPNDLSSNSATFNYTSICPNPEGFAVEWRETLYNLVLTHLDSFNITLNSIVKGEGENLGDDLYTILTYSLMILIETYGKKDSYKATKCLMSLQSLTLKKKLSEEWLTLLPKTSSIYTILRRSSLLLSKFLPRKSILRQLQADSNYLMKSSVVYKRLSIKENFETIFSNIDKLNQTKTISCYIHYCPLKKNIFLSCGIKSSPFSTSNTATAPAKGAKGSASAPPAPVDHDNLWILDKLELTDNDRKLLNLLSLQHKQWINDTSKFVAQYNDNLHEDIEQINLVSTSTNPSTSPTSSNLRQTVMNSSSTSSSSNANNKKSIIQKNERAMEERLRALLNDMERLFSPILGPQSNLYKFLKNIYNLSLVSANAAASASAKKGTPAISPPIIKNIGYNLNLFLDLDLQILPFELLHTFDSFFPGLVSRDSSIHLFNHRLTSLNKISNFDQHSSCYQLPSSSVNYLNDVLNEDTVSITSSKERKTIKDLFDTILSSINNNKFKNLHSNDNNLFNFEDFAINFHTNHSSPSSSSIKSLFCYNMGRFSSFFPLNEVINLNLERLSCFFNIDKSFNDTSYRRQTSYDVSKKNKELELENVVMFINIYSLLGLNTIFSTSCSNSNHILHKFYEQFFKNFTTPPISSSTSFLNSLSSTYTSLPLSIIMKKDEEKDQEQENEEKEQDILYPRTKRWVQASKYVYGVTNVVYQDN